MRPILTLILLVIVNSLQGQSTREIVKDFDGDAIMDLVYIDSDSNTLNYKLSSNAFQVVSSLEISSLNFGNTLVETPNGFEFWNDYGRSGWINEFQYNPIEKKMQLIKIRRTDYDIDRFKFGEEVRYGSGKSSVDLIKHIYIGDFYQVFNGQLIKLPTIKSYMEFTETYLYCFSDAINFKFEERCVELYENAKQQMP